MLPVLFRLWRGKGTASPVELAAQMLEVLAGAFPGREVHGTGDTAFHGESLVDACNRTQEAVERTVPFAFLIQSLMILWYARSCDGLAGPSVTRSGRWRG